MQKINQVFRKKEIVIGTWLSMNDVVIIELAKAAGFDFVRIDNEYVPYDINMIAQLIRIANLAGIPIIVRIARLDDIPFFINFGADGIMIPDATLERTKEAIERVKYAPVGQRAMNGSSRALQVSGLSFKEFHKQANDSISLTVQIENLQGMAEIDEILALEGVDLVGSGRQDVSQALGFPGEPNHPKVYEFEDTVIKKALQFGKIPVMVANNKEERDKYMKKGVNVLIAGRDQNFLSDGMRNLVQALRT